MQSLSTNSLKQYGTSLKLWWEYCHSNQFDVFTSGIHHVLKFLQWQLQGGASYSTLNTSRSALSLILPTVDTNNIGEAHIVKRFMKAAFRVGPKTYRYKSTWDPDPVLQYLSTLYPTESLSLENLTLKLVGLLALATAHRVQTFSLMELENIHEKENGVDIFISQLTKTSAPGKNQPCLFLPFLLEKPQLCVATTLLQYRKRTEPLRNANCNQLLISFVRPHKAVGTQTISRWIKVVMSRGGIDTNVFSAHSTRHASTSSAAAKGVSMDEIRKTASWTASSSVFSRFYHRPVSEQSFAQVVLS